jgi:hypothetical protein
MWNRLDVVPVGSDGLKSPGWISSQALSLARSYAGGSSQPKNHPGFDSSNLMGRIDAPDGYFDFVASWMRFIIFQIRS